MRCSGDLMMYRSSGTDVAPDRVRLVHVTRVRFNRHQVRQCGLSIASFLLLLFALMAIDDRIGEQVSLRAKHWSAIELGEGGAQIQRAMGDAIAIARDQALDHTPLVVFTVAGLVLLIFMLRT